VSAGDDDGGGGATARERGSDPSPAPPAAPPPGLVAVRPSRIEVIVVDDFYVNVEEVVAYAMRQRYYYPFPDSRGRPPAPGSWKHQPPGSETGHRGGTDHWRASYFKRTADDPFKSSCDLVRRLESLTGDRLDLEDWSADFPTDDDQNLRTGYERLPRTSRWNCAFHVKHLAHPPGSGVHTHTAHDSWNACSRPGQTGADIGWAGIVYLSRTPRPVPPGETTRGLMLWRNRRGDRTAWMTPPEDWELVDAFEARFNRLILCRGDLPHSGGSGWGDSVENGRLFQTFFFKILPRPR
jgi:hypothetical protein